MVMPVMNQMMVVIPWYLYRHKWIVRVEHAAAHKKGPCGLSSDGQLSLAWAWEFLSFFLSFFLLQKNHQVTLVKYDSIHYALIIIHFFSLTFLSLCLWSQSFSVEKPTYKYETHGINEPENARKNYHHSRWHHPRNSDLDRDNFKFNSSL